jgi:NAD-specific glutamate dehydrogenase
MPASLWQALERDLLLDDLMTAHATLAAHIAAHAGSGDEGATVDRWVASQPQFARAWRAALESAQGASKSDFSLLSMTCRKIGDLIRTLEKSGTN